LDLGKIISDQVQNIKKVFTIKHLEKFQLLDLDKFHIFHMVEHIFIQVSIQKGKWCRTLEQSMKTDTFQQEVPMSLPTCVTMWSIWELIAAMRIHYKTKTTTVYFTVHFTVHFVGVVQGDIEIYNNINSGVVRGIHKSTTTTLIGVLYVRI
jgi:hypothetical protein